MEDNAINQRLARIVLQKAGAQVEVASDGQAAVTVLEQGAHRFAQPA